MIKNWIFCVVLAGCMVGCSSNPTPTTPIVKTRDFQTRTYDTADNIMVFKAVMNALQDMGISPEVANAQDGIIVGAIESTSVSKARLASKGVSIYLTLGLSLVFGNNNLKNTDQLYVTGNIGKRHQQTKVRVSFTGKRLDHKGQLRHSKIIEDEEFYRQFFLLVDKSMFLEEHQI